MSQKKPISLRFRGYLPVVVDIETGGFNSARDAILELAATVIEMDLDGLIHPGKKYFYNVEPFEGANINKSSLEFTGIDPFNPLRLAVPENQALTETFRGIRKEIKASGCQRAIMVAHNSSFDLGFIMAAAERQDIKRNPFHPFSSFDTATLSGLAFGQTVLSRACDAAHIDYDANQAHAANYDCEITAELFCHIVNEWKQLGGWNPPNND